MLSRGVNLALRLSPRRVITQISAKNTTVATEENIYKQDPAPYFFSQEIQELLYVVTRPVPEKVFRRRLDARELEPPEYKFMTDVQLQKALKKANEQMKELLQMPPVVKVREEDSRVLSKDPALKGYDTANHVFTDITFGVSDKDRVIVVREPDGTLRNATNEERDRMNQIYFPLPGRELEIPRMFKSEYLETVLAREDYIFVLDRACVQFDPDNLEYHRVTKVVYDKVDELMHHDKLRSSRHFGPFVFYLAWHKKINNLLIENITTERIEDAALIIKLYYKLHAPDKAKKDIDNISLIKYFIETEADNNRKLDHVLRTYVELEAKRKNVAENVKKAHGRTDSSNEEIKK